ncbi:MAG: glycerophosphodiester phosphodiesterase [Gammaproteobacteria bacterium]|jgi:glycerophosphoryl diester phosphodiesterase|nr:glycerophosphodiester phosphodiesterase [Gammaproteobacteria bacterium]
MHIVAGNAIPSSAMPGTGLDLLMAKGIFYLQRALLMLVDLGIMFIPRRRPLRAALVDCKIISHRGEHDNRRVRENTLAAFASAAEAGCWGLEFDVRWTQDLQPVVFHDLNAHRVFGIDLVISKVSLAQLQQRIPEIPTLEEVVDRFAGKLHLMVELKRDHLASYAHRSERLREIFAALEPATDYHFLALQAELFDLVEFAGARACLPVAEFNIAELSRIASQRGYAGVCAQYLLLSRALISRHHRQGQQLGSGFAASKFGLFREINRGVDWIFTNHAVRLQAIRREMLRGE